MKVKITRFSNSYKFIGEIDATIIESPRGDNKSGGCNAKSAGYSIYGYIPYEKAINI